MAITKKKPTETEEAPTQPATNIEALAAPPSPTEEIASLNRALAELQRTHELETSRERSLTARYKSEADAFKAERDALLESPLLRVLSNGENLMEIEKRLTALCEKCAHAERAVSGAMALKIKVTSGRAGDGSLEFEITDKVTQPVEDQGACVLWIDKSGKLSESSAKQRDLINVPPGLRRPSPTDEERMDAAK